MILNKRGLVVNHKAWLVCVVGILMMKVGGESLVSHLSDNNCNDGNNNDDTDYCTDNGTYVNRSTVIIGVIGVVIVGGAIVG